MAGEGGDDRGADLEVGGLGAGRGEHGEGVAQAVGLGRSEVGEGVRHDGTTMEADPLMDMRMGGP